VWKRKLGKTLEEIKKMWTTELKYSCRRQYKTELHVDKDKWSLIKTITK